MFLKCSRAQPDGGKETRPICPLPANLRVTAFICHMFPQHMQIVTEIEPVGHGWVLIKAGVQCKRRQGLGKPVLRAAFTGAMIEAGGHIPG